MVYIQVKNSYIEVKYLFDSEQKKLKKEIEKLELKGVEQIEQIIEENETTIKLKVLRWEN